jgi:hypothetical protein
MQAILLIKEHEKSYDALCVALEEGKDVGDCILSIEDNLPMVLPSAQRITDRKIRKKTMESDLLMRYIQKITWKVGGIKISPNTNSSPNPNPNPNSNPHPNSNPNPNSYSSPNPNSNPNPNPNPNYKVGGINAVEYEGNIIQGPNPHEG